MKFPSIIFLLIQLSSFPIFGGETFVVGTGSEFIMKSPDVGKANLQITIAQSSFSHLGIEMNFKDSLGLSQVSQRFDLSLKNQGPLVLEKGYFQANNTKGPLKMTDNFLKLNNDGVQLTNFLFSTKKEINKLKVGREIVEVPGGTLYCTHYRKTRADQTVDFWISDSVKPIGLVKLISQGKKKAHQYTLELNSLIKGAVPIIDPAKARSISKKDKALFPYLFNRKKGL
jgi:hypothetical protein